MDTQLTVIRNLLALVPDASDYAVLAPSDWTHGRAGTKLPARPRGDFEEVDVRRRCRMCLRRLEVSPHSGLCLPCGFNSANNVIEIASRNRPEYQSVSVAGEPAEAAKRSLGCYKLGSSVEP